MLATRKWANGLLPEITWVLLAVSVLVYCCLLVMIACSGRRHSSSPVYSAKSMVKFISEVAQASAVFLIAEGYLLINGFNNDLVITILGKQVHTVLKGPQLAVLLIFLSASLLTVGLCTRLLLLGRREELQLLAMVGWERQAVMWRLLADYCAPSLISGAIGVLLALAVAALVEASPTAFLMLSLLVSGPLLGALMSGVATIGNAWQETGRVFRWR
jgi:hypothetical protein